MMIRMYTLPRERGTLKVPPLKQHCVHPKRKTSASLPIEGGRKRLPATLQVTAQSGGTEALRAKLAAQNICTNYHY